LKLLGWTPFALRLPSAVVSTLALPATFALGRRLFGGRVALLAAFLMAISLWQVALGRLGETFSALPFFAALSGYWLVRWLQGRRWRAAVLCGLSCGLTLYAYTPGRFVPVLVALAWAGAMLSWPKLRPTLLRQGTALAGVAAAAFLPLGVYFLTNPGTFNARANDLSI